MPVRFCRNCIHAVIGNTKGDKAMASMGYSSCAASRTPEELGRYFTGGNRCIYPGRFRIQGLKRRGI